jgi:hypothetical protein
VGKSAYGRKEIEMKKIVSREEFAKLVNFGKYPVLNVDMNQEGFMNEIFDGCKVKVDFGYFKTGERYLEAGEFKYYKKENKFYVANYGTCISNRFCYEDAMEAVENAQAPLIDEGQEVVIVVNNSKEKTVDVYLAKAINKRKFCSTMLEFE